MALHITMRQLQVFEAVARHLSFTRAAGELHLTQPAVSMQVKQLEAMVELPLFEQLGKKIHITEAGLIILQHSRTMISQLDQIERDVNRLKGVEGGSLKVCISSTVNYFATRLLAAFSKQHQSVRIDLEVIDRDQLVERLEENETDLALMGKPPEHLDVEATPFMDNPLVLVANPRHPLAGKKNINLQALCGETFVMRKDGSNTRAAVLALFEQHNVQPGETIHLAGNETVKQNVEAGIGLAVVSAHTVELELKARRLVTLDVKGFPIVRKWYISHRRGKRLSETASVFRDFIIQQGRNL